jgi:hypothetical protein
MKELEFVKAGIAIVLFVGISNWCWGEKYLFFNNIRKVISTLKGKKV